MVTHRLVALCRHRVKPRRRLGYYPTQPPGPPLRYCYFPHVSRVHLQQSLVAVVSHARPPNQEIHKSDLMFACCIVDFLVNVLLIGWAACRRRCRSSRLIKTTHHRHAVIQNDNRGRAGRIFVDIHRGSPTYSVCMSKGGLILGCDY